MADPVRAKRATAGAGVVRPVRISPDRLIAGTQPFIIAGPCSVESAAQILQMAQLAKSAGAHALRGGAFKPRTSPYSFQGLGKAGLQLLDEARRATGLPVVTELLDVRDADLVCQYADVVQIGSRNMQNFPLLREAGGFNKPVLLKRGFAATLEEWILAAEYVLAHGNDQVILCERGIRTFEPSVRNVLDVAAIVHMHLQTHLPVIADPSHAGGDRRLVGPLAKAALAAGADGLMIEVHPDPARALSDGQQSLSPEEFAALMADLGFSRKEP